MAKSTMTVGERYTQEVKRTYAKTEKVEVLDRQEAARQKLARMQVIARKFLNLPRSVKIDCEKLGSYGTKIKINGRTCEIESRNFYSFVEEDEVYAALNQALEEDTNVKRDKCKELAFLNEQMASAGINAFKAYVRAKLDKLEAAGTGEMNATAFTGLVKEYLSTRREHTCPL